MTKTTVAIPADLIPEFEAWGKATAELFGKLRIRAGIKPKHVPPDQAWFWTKEWQKKEQEADEAIAKGDYIEFANIEDALKYLHQ